MCEKSQIIKQVGNLWDNRLNQLFCHLDWKAAKIRPITKDISELVTMPGVYKIEFNWTGGIDPLVIYRVEVTS